MERMRTAFGVLWLTTILFLWNVCVCSAENQKKVLWIGTSIPAGCTYPQVSCDNNGLTCINKAIGASFIREDDSYKIPPFLSHYGLSLSLSSDEKEQIYRQYVESGELSEALLDTWKNASYDRCMMDYVNDVDYIVFDHGYNDGDILETELDNVIDWSSEDRHTFIGAFNFLYSKIKEKNPNVKVIVGGYFQNKCTISYLKRGLYVSQIMQKIAEHYDLPLLDVWNNIDIPDGYAPNSSSYLEDLNKRYGTSFTKVFQDVNGNITYFQKFCPDAVHPFTDPTGESDRKLNDVFTVLLGRAINGASGIQQIVGDTRKGLPVIYNIQGTQRSNTDKNVIYIINGRKFFER